MTPKDQDRDMDRERVGWLTLAGFMLLFPALFFLCVYFPIWIGVATPY